VLHYPTGVNGTSASHACERYDGINTLHVPGERKRGRKVLASVQWLHSDKRSRSRGDTPPPTRALHLHGCAVGHAAETAVMFAVPQTRRTALRVLSSGLTHDVDRWKPTMNHDVRTNTELHLTSQHQYIRQSCKKGSPQQYAPFSNGEARSGDLLPWVCCGQGSPCCPLSAYSSIYTPSRFCLCQEAPTAYHLQVLCLSNIPGNRISDRLEGKRDTNAGAESLGARSTGSTSFQSRVANIASVTEN
jgi:hypothetical protein